MTDEQKATLAELHKPSEAEQLRAEIKELRAAVTNMAKGNKPLRRSVMSQRDAVRYINEHGRDAYLKLPM
jgi:hypothetical protein